MALQNTSINVNMTYGESQTVGLLSPSAPANYAFNSSWTDGTGAGKAQKIATVALSIVSGAPVTYDLTAMVGGPFASAINFSKIKVMIIENTANANNFLVGNAATNQFSAFVSAAGERVVCGPGETRILLCSQAGYTVDGTRKSLKIDADSGTVTGKLIIIGEGA